MKRQIVILANSFRPGGRCVAGICMDTGEWIRPVSRSANRAVPGVTSISSLDLLSIVEVSFAGDRPTPFDRYQCENWFGDSWDWNIVGQCSVKDAKRLCENMNVVLHTSGDSVEPALLDALPPSDWKSLQLIKAKVDFTRDTRDRTRWRASFDDGQANSLYLKVTDAATCAKLDEEGDISRECLLTISLAVPWAPADGSQPERCYKLVAGVIWL
jgi:hypothetical protein